MSRTVFTLATIAAATLTSIDCNDAKAGGLLDPFNVVQRAGKRNFGAGWFVNNSNVFVDAPTTDACCKPGCGCPTHKRCCPSRKYDRFCRPKPTKCDWFPGTPRQPCLPVHRYCPTSGCPEGKCGKCPTPRVVHGKCGSPHSPHKEHTPETKPEMKKDDKAKTARARTPHKQG